LRASAWQEITNLELRFFMTILIIHGIGGHAGIHWQKWLAEKLEDQGIKVIMPNMPNALRPQRTEWLSFVKNLLEDINDDLVIIGHSLGVTTALDYLEQTDKPIKALISTSGFAKDYSLELNSYFLSDKEISWEKVEKNLENAFVLYGDNDPYVPQEVLKDLADNLNIKPTIFKNGGHLNTESGYTEFPEILKIVQSLT